MTTYDGYRRRIQPLFAELSGLAVAQSSEAAVHRLTAAEKRLHDARLTLVVLGEFNLGKSQLLNAFLEEPGLFPVNAAVATSVVTTACWAAEERVVVTLENEKGEREERPISREEIARYVTESGDGAGDGKRAVLVSIGLPNPRLESGLVLVDTPGVGGVHRDHTAATLAFLPMADCVLYLTQATVPPLAAELAFIAKAAEAVRAAEDPDAIVFAVTKTDLVTDVEEALAETRSRLAGVPGLPADRLTVVPVSSAAKLQYLAEGDPEDLESSNFPELERRLGHALERSRTRLHLVGALTELDLTAQDLAAPLEAAVTALEAGSTEERERLAAKAAAAVAELDALTGGERTWRAELTAELDELGRRLKHQAEAAITAAWQQVGDPSAEPGTLSAFLPARLGAIVTEVEEAAAAGVAEIRNGFAARTGLQLELPALAGLSLPALPVPDTLPAVQHDAGALRAEEVVQAFAAAASTAEKTAQLGGYIGGVLTGLTPQSRLAGVVVGRVLGGLLGSLIVFRQTLTEAAKANELAAAAQRAALVRSGRSEHIGILRSGIDQIVGELGRALDAELRTRVAERRAALTAAQEEIARAATLGAAEAQERLTELRERLRPITELRRRIGELAAEIAEGGAVDAA